MADKNLTGKKIVMVIAQTQFRDEEFFEPKKILEAAGGTVVVGSTSVRLCHGTQGGSVQSQVAIADVKADEFDALDMYHATRGGEDALARKRRDDAIRSGHYAAPADAAE